MVNTPFYIDLSTYFPQKITSFYENVFDWKFYKSDNYYAAFLADKKIAGLYETPEKFKQMKMPDFWMTYFKVKNVDEILYKVKSLGGIIELNYKSDFGKIALIRDPKGAGFTIYEGDKLENIRTNNIVNTLIWSELQVSEVDKVFPFYKNIFNWDFRKKNNNIFTVYSNDIYIADFIEIPNSLKGKYEYWVCTFGVENLQQSHDLILKNNGKLISNEGDRMLFTDNSNQSFFYIKEVN